MSTRTKYQIPNRIESDDFGRIEIGRKIIWNDSLDPSNRAPNNSRTRDRKYINPVLNRDTLKPGNWKTHNYPTPGRPTGSGGTGGKIPINGNIENPKFPKPNVPIGKPFIPEPSTDNNTNYPKNSTTTNSDVVSERPYSSGDISKDSTDDKYTNNFGEPGIVVTGSKTPEKYRPIDFDNLVPIQITTSIQQKMFKNLCIPSAMHAYSVGVEFFKQWVLNKFNKNFFKTVYVDGKHLFDEFANLNELQLIKKGKPAIGFFPNIDIDYNREGIEAQTYDLMYFARTFDNRDAFFKDKENKIFISIAMEQFSMPFSVKIKVNTRAKQLDIAKYLKVALKVGATSGYYLDLDMHVPYELLFALAEKVGFEVDYEKKQIKDPFKFLLYLNSKSDVPFVYKLRSINGQNEFFLRAPNMYTHISVSDLSIDEGERQNQVSSNYYIELTARLLMPAPKVYCLFSTDRIDTISMIDKAGNLRSYVANFTNVPTINERGWEQFITLDYQEEDRKNPLVIDLMDIFQGENNIYSLIEYNKYNLLSPSTFIDFKLFNNNKEWKYIVDWDDMTIRTLEPVDYQLTEVVIYVDKAYVNTQTITMQEDSDYRVTYNKTAGNNTNQSFYSEEKMNRLRRGLFKKK